MKISVVIPTYNSAKFIAATIESVFRQTVPPDEILILDDGSKDDTVSILNSYGPRVTIFQQANRGVAAARNELCKRASGDLIAFLDHDDIWHPSYLEVQSRQSAKHLTATAFFTLHVNFYGYGGHEWRDDAVGGNAEPQVIAPASFVGRYNNSTGTFYSMSFCCIPKRLLALLGDAPFCETVSGVDDCYICNLLPLHGPVVFTPVPLVAYRVTPQAQSSNQLKNFQMVVQVFESLERLYRDAADTRLLRAFNLAFAGKKRRYGKTLMGAGRISEARNQFFGSMNRSSNPASMAKSVSLFCVSYMPSLLQPRWPSGSRQSAVQTGKTG
jgi:glycosyltransferase involved in cell wall biosynthesis